MHDFTATWAWPQWAILSLLFVRFVMIASKHGQEKLETLGERKGQPSKYDGFTALGQTFIWAFILIAGGFFA